MISVRHLALLLGIKQAERTRMRQILIRVRPHMKPDILVAGDRQLLEWMYQVKGYRHHRHWAHTNWHWPQRET